MTDRATFAPLSGLKAMIRALRPDRNPPGASIVQRLHGFYARAGPTWRRADGDSCSAKPEWVVIRFVFPAFAGTTDTSEQIKNTLASL
jgi:hypothetical protein